MVADYYVIKAKRFELGMTQKELAERAQISPSVVYKAERGQSISATTNGRIRKALGLL